MYLNLTLCKTKNTNTSKHQILIFLRNIQELLQSPFAIIAACRYILPLGGIIDYIASTHGVMSWMKNAKSNL